MSSAVLEAKGLFGGYRGMSVVRDLDLHVGAGEVVALLGANGAGKTTTLLTLAGELAPIAGEIRMLGEPARGSLVHRARRGLALIPEEGAVFMGLTVRQNLRLGRGDPAVALALFPELDEHLNRRVGLLSGGQQRILTVARMLAARPVVLLADELSMGLAPLIVQRLLSALRSAAQEYGVGILLVEQHVRSALAIADRAYVMRRGQCVMEGDAAEMLERISDIEESYLASTGPLESERP